MYESESSAESDAAWRSCKLIFVGQWYGRIYVSSLLNVSVCGLIDFVSGQEKKRHQVELYSMECRAWELMRKSHHETNRKVFARLVISDI